MQNNRDLTQDNMSSQEVPFWLQKMTFKNLRPYVFTFGITNLLFGIAFGWMLKTWIGE